LNLTSLPLERQQFIQTVSSSLPEFLSREDRDGIASAAYNALHEGKLDLFRSFTALADISRDPTLSDHDKADIARAWGEYTVGNIAGFHFMVAAVSASTSDVARAETREWKPQDQADFIPFLHSSVDMDYFRSASYAEQVRTVDQALERYLRERNIVMDPESRHNFAEAMATIMHGEFEGQDRDIINRARHADTVGDLRREATYITIGERNAATAFFEGQAPSFSSALDQQAAMVDTFLEALRNFGLELSEEETKLKEELEDYREDMEKLASELEDGRTKFARELNGLGDKNGLKFLADALEGSANPGTAEWNEFWTKERVFAFRNALRE
jgi:hypothetical protein